MTMKKLAQVQLHEMADKVREQILRMTPDEAGRFLGVGVTEEKIPRAGLLTPRERAVYDLVVAEQPNGDIARKLGISLGSVYAYRAQINRKLGAGTTTELVLRAGKQGLL